MSRPRPLSNVATGRPQFSDYQSLTPRTPHSRHGRAEEGFTEIELDNAQEEDYRTDSQQQTRPLLASSNDTGYRSRGDDYGQPGTTKELWGGISLKVVLDRLPLTFGSLLAFLLFVLIVVSIKRPEELQKFVGAKVTTESATASIPESISSTQAAAPTPSLDNSLSTPPPQHAIHDTTLLSYENYTTFPLHPTEYRDECAKLMKGFMSHPDYWTPSAHGTLDVPHKDTASDGVCSSTITYMLDGYVGLFADLGLMAQAAALARERNRTFLVDDTYWNRGKWTNYFEDVRAGQPGPEPGCKPPSPEELVACPRLARHWVINSRTAKFHFGHGFANHYEDSYSQALNRQKPIFKASLESFTDVMRPNAQATGLIDAARTEFIGMLLPDRKVPQVSQQETPDQHSFIGVHIRRGDRLAVSWAYHGGYVPVPNYAEAAQKTWRRLVSNDTSSKPVVYIASDSPTAQLQFTDALPDALVYSLRESSRPELKELASKEEYVQSKFGELSEEERIKATHGAIVDFALVSGVWSTKAGIVPVATVCTISSNICKLSPIGLGWERAFGAVNQPGEVDELGKGWVEIDNRDQIRPIWQGFEIF